MLTLNDIINASFRKSGFSGYRVEDVDQFIDQVKESFDALQKRTISQKEEYEKLKAENDLLTDKIKILAQKVEDYRSEEEEIKNALVSAQKLGDASVREARHKAEIILKDANLKAERIIANADQAIIEQKKEMERLQKQAADFRTKLLDLYKQHLTLINALPVQKPEEKAQEPATPAAVPEEPVREEPAPAQNVTPTVSHADEAPLSQAFHTGEEPADDDADPLFRAEVSNFDDTQAFEALSGHYTAIQFGAEEEK
ncbi:DivIVA domain-containing protein [Caproiciproducens sp. LBM24188]|nr:DivIVA domain-containing protein [Oscillospiraceae bacterium]HHV32473.1 DivIVA domain-containing protein [Clostridiales bacterium]